MFWVFPPTLQLFRTLFYLLNSFGSIDGKILPAMMFLIGGLLAPAGGRPPILGMFCILYLDIILWTSSLPCMESVFA